MKFSKKTEGAISVFLVIILVPCLFISALFVDVGRVYLSRGMSYSAADLALNTAMTQYDGLLNEYYGLVASCQDMDEFYTESADFFLRTISSQDLEDEEILALANQYANLTSDDTIYDLLKAEPVGDIKIEPLAGANLSNSTMLKEQVVEFMKYRGPITVVTEIIDRLTAESDGLNAAKDADENEEVIEAKEEYAEAEAELLEDAYEVYKYLYTEYSTSYNGSSPYNELLSGYAMDLIATRESYREIHELAIKNLVGTSGLTRFYRPTVTLDDDKYSYTDSGIYSRKDEDPANEGSYLYIITGTDWDARLDELESAIDTFTIAKSNMADKMNSISHTADTNQVQYWKAVSEAIASDGNYAAKVQNAGNTVADLYSKCYAMADCQYENVTPEMEQRWIDLEIEATELCDKYLTAGVADNTDTYLILVNRLESYSAANEPNISASSLYVSSGSATVEVMLATNSAHLDTIIMTCDTYIEILTNLIDGANGVNSVSSLKDEAKDYDDKYDDYVDEVNSLTPTVESTADSKNFKDTELENIEADRQNYSDAINEESVRELEDRLINIRSQFIAVKSAAEAMKYGSKTVLAIENYSAMSTAASGIVKEDELGLTNTELEAYASETFATLFSPSGTVNDSIVTINTSNDYNLELIPANSEGETGSVAVPELYNYLHLKFKDVNGTEKEKVENDLETAKGAEDENNSEDIDDQLFDLYPEKIEEALIATEGGVRGVPCSALDGFGALITTIDSLVGGNYDDIRDELYIAIYMTQMFSYATYEREGQYHLFDALAAPDGDVITLTKSNFNTAYGKVSGEGEGEWKSTISWDTYNKSLTNKMINSTNNPAYRCEVEYILYGNENHEKNVDAAFGNIFAIRAALNTVSVFQYFWSGRNITASTINAIAMGASALTSGIVPPSVIKVVLLLVLSAIETCNDMNRLAAGWPVELYKDENDWQVSLQVQTDSISTALSELTRVTEYTNPTGKGLFYSDYLTLFVCMGMLNESKAESMVLRMGDVIQHNMRAVTGEDTYALSNSVTHFKFTGTLEVDPLVVNAPLFNEYNGAFNSETGWGQYKLELIRGY